MGENRFACHIAFIRRCGTFILALVLLGLPGIVFSADPDSNIQEVISTFSSLQRLHIQTDDFRVLHGRFIRSDGDSLYIGQWPKNITGRKNLLASEPQKAESIQLSNISHMWMIKNHGLKRGLLWGGVVLLIGGFLTIEQGDEIDTIETALVYFGVTAAATLYAFFKGISGSEETLVYSRYQ
jgi:hypothetical protein